MYCCSIDADGLWGAETHAGLAIIWDCRRLFKGAFQDNIYDHLIIELCHAEMATSAATQLGGPWLCIAVWQDFVHFPGLTSS